MKGNAHVLRRDYDSFGARPFFLVGILFASLAFIETAPSGFAVPRWHVEIVDDGQGTDVGMYSSMAIDRSGNVHIGYFNTSTMSLQYSYRGRQDQKWSKMTVERGAGTFASFAVDAHGWPHFAYHSPVRKGLRYAHWDGKQWHIQVIDSVTTQFSTSLQLDGSGNPRVAYFEIPSVNKGAGQKLKYAYFDGTTWFTKTIALRPRQGVYNAMALDSGGRTHIAFAQSGHLEYASYDGSHWQFDAIDSTSDTDASAGLGLTLALDPEGDPQLAYFDSAKKTLKYAYRKSGIWKMEVVEQFPGTPKFPDSASIRLDIRNEPHIAYYDSGSGVLKYAVRRGGEWIVEVVDHQGMVGMYPSLSLDTTGQPYIAYYDLTNKQVRIAHLNPEIPVPKSSEKP
jgi:hypothetical protein